MTARERERLSYDLDSLERARNHERAVRNRSERGLFPMSQQEQDYSTEMLALLSDDILKLKRRLNPRHKRIA